MSHEKIELIRGSGNVFRDLDLPNPELEQFRAVLAARIIKVLDQTGMSVRKAQEMTGTAAADFSRIRQANLSRFTVDRLMGILHRLDQQVEISVKMRSRRRVGKVGSAHAPA